MSAEEIKLILQTPAALFVLMLVASLGSAFKQIVENNASSPGSTTFGAYLKHMPETLVMLGGNVIAFVTLLMTDQLNFAAALGIGYSMNSIAGGVGALTRGAESRTALMTTSKE